MDSKGQNRSLASRIRPLFHIAITFSIASYLAYKLSIIGWTNIIAALPTAVEFYLLAMAFVFLPIMTERLAFPMAIKAKASPPLRVFIRKHAINKAVMNYAGEGYFLKKISGWLKISLIDAAVIVKNLALARTFAANFWILLLVITAITFGNAEVLNSIMTVSPELAIAVGTISVGFCLGSVIFFRKLTRLDFGVAAKISSLYLLRSFFAACILITQWNLMLPGTALTVWFLFLIVFFIAKKSPIGGDLVFVSVALTLPGLTGNSATIAAMLLANAVVLQIIYSMSFIFTSDFTSKLKPLRSIKRASNLHRRAH